MLSLIIVLHPTAPVPPPPQPPTLWSSKYSEHRDQTMLQVVAYRRITTMEKLKLQLKKVGGSRRATCTSSCLKEMAV